MMHDAEPGRLVAMLERMLLIRAFEACLPDLYTRKLVRGSAHPAIGQETVAVGACFCCSTNSKTAAASLSVKS